MIKDLRTKLNRAIEDINDVDNELELAQLRIEELEEVLITVQSEIGHALDSEMSDETYNTLEELSIKISENI